MASDETPGALTRRDLLAGSAGLAVAAAAGPAMAESRGPTGGGAAAALRGTVTWEEFCESLKPLARHLSTEAAAADPQLAIEGVRLLGRMVALGLDRFLEHGDPRHPDFYELQTPVRKYMGDSPDQTYRATSIEGGGSYRIRGTAAGAAGVEIGVYAGTFSSDTGAETRRLVASLDEKKIDIAKDGTFEVTASPEPGDRNHLQLDDGANALLIRTYFWDRELRRQHLLPRIERLDVTGPAPPLTPRTLLRGMLATVPFVDGSLDWWNRYVSVQPPANTLIEMPDDGTVMTPSLVRYVNGVVAPGAEQAVLIEFTPRPEPDYWSWTLQNLWGETPDWRDRPVIKNNRELVRGKDGSVRIVVAHRDPGVPNWMDMSGHQKLLISLRWRGKEPLPKVATRVVPLGEFT